MSKKFLILLLPLILLACNFVSPAAPATSTPTQLPSVTPSMVPASPTPEPTRVVGFTLARIHENDGDLFTQLASEAQKAKSLGQMPFIEFDATWCTSCRAIDKSLKAHDPLTTDAFEGVYLIRADVDEWGWGDEKAFKFEGIPVFFKLDGDGQPTGAVVDGSAWDEDIPVNFAPVLKKFFHQ